ncbi:MAG: hypothetical protein LBP58_03085 [Azoarcus sp.]|jgi:hypothetical protein|nr:hypothetical protein [Azoarcus sp.]
MNTAANDKKFSAAAKNGTNLCRLKTANAAVRRLRDLGQQIERVELCLGHGDMPRVTVKRDLGCSIVPVLDAARPQRPVWVDRGGSPRIGMVVFSGEHGDVLVTWTEVGQ